MSQQGTRKERRQQQLIVARGRRKLFERALSVGQEVEADLKRVVNKLPFFARVGIALRIIIGAWK